jgi:hypothetical protein
VIYTATDDSGNDSTCVFTVRVDALPNADAGLDQTVTAGSPVTLGGSPSASGGTAPYTYRWFDMNATPPVQVTISPNPLQVPLVSTLYKLFVFDANDCVGTDEVVITVTAPIAPEDGSDKADGQRSSLQLYPNPASESVIIALSTGNALSQKVSIEVFDLLGRSVYAWHGKATETLSHKVDLANLLTGQYLVKTKIGEEVIVEMLTLNR